MAEVLAQFDDLAMDRRLIVVDNDPGESARAVVEGIASDPAISVPVAYVAEATPGIPAARNAALDAAEDRRLLVFIDDDETPHDGWLRALVTAWESWDCDGVAGPTIRLLDEPSDPWVAASGFFERTSRRSGTVLRGAPTGNLLLDLEAVRRFGLRFDERFHNTGGSDTFFTRQFVGCGGVIRWCDEAVTSEPTPQERSTREWVLARDRRVGNTWSRTHLMLADTRPARGIAACRLVGLAAKLSLFGAVRLAVGRARSDLASRARGERDIARARGLLMAIRGMRVEEYRRADVPHG